jgi:DNA (cytosine-5)-methyltransferase 1
MSPGSLPRLGGTFLAIVLEPERMTVQVFVTGHLSTVGLATSMGEQKENIILGMKTELEKITGQQGHLWDKMSPEMPSEPLPYSSSPRPLALLSRVRKHMSQHDLAARLQVAPKTISRWENQKTDCPTYVEAALKEILRLGVQEHERAVSFTFIDLFAGIGGIRSGFEAADGKCIFTSEWNPWAQKTYSANYSSDEPLVGDITKVVAEDIPNHDVLLAGFPCQPFSIAGVSKKNALGRPHGFECTTQGTLFFDVARIIAEKRPKAFLLENVKNLLSHDKGNTFRVIRQTLKDELGYRIASKVIDGQCFVPQHRERLLIAGFREDTGFSLDNIRLPERGPKLRTILHPEDGGEPAEEPYTVGPEARVHPKYTLTTKLWAIPPELRRETQTGGKRIRFWSRWRR